MVYLGCWLGCLCGLGSLLPSICSFLPESWYLVSFHPQWLISVIASTGDPALLWHRLSRFLYPCYWHHPTSVNVSWAPGAMLAAFQELSFIFIFFVSIRGNEFAEEVIGQSLGCHHHVTRKFENGESSYKAQVSFNSMLYCLLCKFRWEVTEPK